MSVLMTLWVQGNPDELERRAAANPDAIRAISDKAKEFGLIAHRFYGTDGQIMVIDEWPDARELRALLRGSAFEHRAADAGGRRHERAGNQLLARARDARRRRLGGRRLGSTATAQSSASREGSVGRSSVPTRSIAASAIARSWIASPVESNSVMSLVGACVPAHRRPARRRAS